MHLLEPGADLTDLLAPYAAVRRTAPNRCWVMANMVGSLSGSAAVGGRVGALSHGPDAQLFTDMRSLADVVMVGAETVRREGYGPVRLRPELVEVRQAAGRPDVPPIAIVTRSLDLDWGSRVFTEAADDARTLIITGEAADPQRLAQAREVADVIVAGTDRVEPGLALAELHRRGHRVVLCEGGPSLLGELAAEGLLDELCLTVAPILGGDPLPVSVAPPGSELQHLSLRHAVAADDTLFLRYERKSS